MCFDWLVFSEGMKERERLYKTETADDVYFGVGSYGSDSSRGGQCYRLTVSGVDKDLIVQVINQGIIYDI